MRSYNNQRRVGRPRSKEGCTVLVSDIPWYVDSWDLHDWASAAGEVKDANVEFKGGLSQERVLVQFGKQRIYSALIFHVHQNEPREYKAKALIDVIDVRPIVNEYQFKLWQWIAEYYMCTLGEVMIAALGEEHLLACHPMVKQLHADVPSAAAEIYAASVALSGICHLSYVADKMGIS